MALGLRVQGLGFRVAQLKGFRFRVSPALGLSFPCGVPDLCPWGYGGSGTLCARERTAPNSRHTGRWAIARLLAASWYVLS